MTTALKVTTILATIGVLLFAATGFALSTGTTVWLDEVWYANGNSYNYPISLENEGSVSEIVVPLSFLPDADIKVDSITFTGTRLDGLGTTTSWFDNDANLLWIDFEADAGSPLPMGIGPIANLHFTVYQNAVPVDLDVDTTFIPPDKSFTVNAPGGPVSDLEFLPGIIHLIAHKPVIDLDPVNFEFETVQGVDPTPQTLSIRNLGIDPLNWHFSYLPSWLNVSSDEGSAPSDIQLMPDMTGMGVDIYHDSLAVSDSLAANHIVWAWITLRIGESPSTGLAGVVQDPTTAPIGGATVELWDTWPTGSIQYSAASGGDGSFAFPSVPDGGYDLYAYKTGFYPTLMSATAPDDNIVVTLQPTPDPNPSDRWITLSCDDNYLDDNPLPVGSVVEAWDQMGTLCGQYFVSTAGAYGPMLVFGDNPGTPGDEGADPGEELVMTINALPASAWPTPIWTFNGDSYEVCLNSVPVDTMCFELVKGWQLISWNLDTYTDDIQTLFAGIMDSLDVALSFENAALTFDPDLVQFSTLQQADYLHGYWIRMDGPAELCIVGTPVDPETPIELNANWNLASYLPTQSDDIENALNSIFEDFQVGLGFDNGGLVYDANHPELATLTTLSPGFGYWLRLTQPATLIYPGAAPLQFIIHDQSSMKAATSQDGVHPSPEWIDAYGSELTVDGAPLRTGALVSFYDSEGDLCGRGQISDGGVLPFTPIYRDHPGTAVDEGAEPGERLNLTVDDMPVAEQVVWQERGERIALQALTTLAKSDAVLPQQYSLNQNFPNPFNPQTMISFSLPQSGDVKLEIFNILGERVRTLADGPLTAGSYRYTWDGKDNAGRSTPSGIYLYRLSAEGFESTRKMLLLK